MTTEKKVIGGMTLLAIALLLGGVFFLSGNASSPISRNSNNKTKTAVSESEIVTRNGIHWHPKLSIYIKGEKQALEDKIGLGVVHQPLHTHTEDYQDGVVHMEFQGIVTNDDTKLGNFFRIWGKEFNAIQIFDKKNGEEGNVTMMVNGKKNTEFEKYMMKNNDMIEIRYE